MLEPEQHQALTEMAQRNGESLSQLVREIVCEHLAQRQRKRERGLRALKELDELRQEFEEKYGVIEIDLLEEVRRGREEDFERVMRGEA